MAVLDRGTVRLHQVCSSMFGLNKSCPPIGRRWAAKGTRGTHWVLPLARPLLLIRWLVSSRIIRLVVGHAAFDTLKLKKILPDLSCPYPLSVSYLKQRIHAGSTWELAL